jgi:hypothetical protein
MAKLKKQVLGKVSGAVGDIVFRNRYESNYIALRPMRFNTPKDDRSIARRNRFKSAIQLASAMNSIVALKELWHKHTSGNNTVYNRMVKFEYPSLVNQLPSDNSELFPGRGFSATVQTIELNQDNMKIVTDALGTDSGIDTQIEKTIRLVSVIALSSPSDTAYPEIAYLPLISTPKNLVLTNPVDITIDFNSGIKELMNIYQEKRLLAGLITFDTELQPVSFSVTIYHQQ